MRPDASNSTDHSPVGQRAARGAPLDALSAAAQAPVEDLLLQALDQAALLDALDHLGARERAVVILRGAEGIRWKEIQSRLGLSEGEARSAWRSALPKLTALLSGLR